MLCSRQTRIENTIFSIKKERKNLLGGSDDREPL